MSNLESNEPGYDEHSSEPVKTLDGEVRICGADCGLELYVDPDGNGWHLIRLTPWLSAKVRVKH